jgi:hypothetical protein
VPKIEYLNPNFSLSHRRFNINFSFVSRVIT